MMIINFFTVKYGNISKSRNSELKISITKVSLSPACILIIDCPCNFTTLQHEDSTAESETETETETTL